MTLVSGALLGMANAVGSSVSAVGSSASAVGSQNVQERRMMGLSAFDRHQSLMKNAIKYYRAQLPPEQQTVKTDYDVLKEQYRSAPSVAVFEILQPYKKPFGIMIKCAQVLAASLLLTSCDERSDEHPMHHEARRQMLQPLLQYALLGHD